jgi:membrane associated rhomboid family serine protease
MALSANLILIIFTGFVSWKAIEDPALKFKLSHYPYEVLRKKEYYRWITSGLVHADWMHLLFNMIALWVFGGMVEQKFQEHFGEWIGRFVYLGVYFSAILVADFAVFLKHKHNPTYLSLGASGAVAAILFSGILFEPRMPISMMFMPSMPGFVFGILYLFFEWWAGERRMDNINHDAHFWGAIYGFIVSIILIPSAYGDFVNNLIYGYGD